MDWRKSICIDSTNSVDIRATNRLVLINTLRQADEKQAYTLSDEATFWHPRDVKTAASFAAWLTRGEGRRHIERHLIEGRVAFHVRPDGCPATKPDALPCS